jgi:hypothetical protein
MRMYLSSKYAMHILSRLLKDYIYICDLHIIFFENITVPAFSFEVATMASIIHLEFAGTTYPVNSLHLSAIACDRDL